MLGIPCSKVFWLFTIEVFRSFFIRASLLSFHKIFQQTRWLWNSFQLLLSFLFWLQWLGWTWAPLAVVGKTEEEKQGGEKAYEFWCEHRLRGLWDTESSRKGLWSISEHKKRREQTRNKSSRTITGWDHLVKEQIDTEGHLVFQNDTVVRVPSEWATKTTYCVSAVRETGKCVMQFRHGLLKNKCTFVFKFCSLKAWAFLSLRIHYFKTTHSFLMLVKWGVSVLPTHYVLKVKNFCCCPRKFTTSYLTQEAWYSFKCKMQEACPSEHFFSLKTVDLQLCSLASRGGLYSKEQGAPTSPLFLTVEKRTLWPGRAYTSGLMGATGIAQELPAWLWVTL